MIDHMGLTVRDADRSRRFYDGALATLTEGAPNEPRLHVAFRADNRRQVDAFVLDPDGHNIEAVCHFPDTGS